MTFKLALWYAFIALGIAVCLYGALFCCLRAMPKWVFVVRNERIEIRTRPLFNGGMVNDAIDRAYAPVLRGEAALRERWNLGGDG